MRTVLQRLLSLLFVIALVLVLFGKGQASTSSNETVQKIAENDDEEVIERVALEAVAKQPDLLPVGYQQFSLNNVRIVEDWAFMSLSSLPKNTDITQDFLPPFLVFAVGQKQGPDWSVTLETDPNYINLLQALPETLLPKESKQVFASTSIVFSQSSAQSTQQATYSIPHLPWAEGESWRYTQSPGGTFSHRDSPSAFDFGTPTQGQPGTVFSADAGILIEARETCLAIQRSDGLILWYQHINMGDVERWKGSLYQPINAMVELGKTTTLGGCGGGNVKHHLHFEILTKLSGPRTKVDYQGSSINDWVLSGETLVRAGVTLHPNYKDLVEHKHNTVPLPPPPVTGNSWAEEQFSVQFPWYYLISAGDSRVLTVKLDGEVLFQRPACAKALWLGRGIHIIQYEYQSSNSTPEVHRQFWPFVSPTCAAEPLDPPPSQATPPPVSTPPPNDASAYEADVTLPDGITVLPNQGITKIWRLRNTGTSTWGNGYKLVFIRGDRMGAPESVDVPVTAPGSTVNLSVPLVTPNKDGSYSGYWQLRNPQGTFFGNEIWAKINVKSPNTNTITLLYTDPPSPSNTNAVTIRSKVENFPNFRAMRIKIDGEVKYETGSTELNFTWNTTGYQPGDHSITVEVADGSDLSWSRAHSRSVIYRLTGTSTGVNHTPNRPAPRSPHDWYVYYSGNTANLCANNNGDPDGDAITGYYFEVNGAQNWNSGWTSNSCVTTSSLGPYNYEWRVRVRDSRGAESDWSDRWHFIIVNPNLTITELRFEPQDSASERVKIRACTAGQGGVGITMRVSVNDKVEGSNEPDQWHIIHELGVPCYSDIDAPIWTTLENKTGYHKVRVEAHGASTGWDGATVREETFYVPEHRPDWTRLISPVPASQNPREPIFLPSQDITFQWKPTLRAQNYTLHIGTSPNPSQSSNPIYRQTFSSGTLQATVHFGQAYDLLYWQVTASNGLGSNSSNDQMFGIDIAPPTCSINLPGTTTSQTDFTVSWLAGDGLSGIKSVDIQYKDGDRGNWQDWLVAVPATQTSGVFKGQLGHSYSFRCRSIDNANQVGSYSAESPFISVTQPQSQADLEIERVRVFPEPEGGYLIAVTVRNRGTSSTGNGFFTDLYLDHIPTGKGDFTGSLQFWVNDPIPAGGRATLTARIDGPPEIGLMAAAPGGEVSAMLYVQTDSAGSLNEENNLNNISDGTEICFASGDIYESDNDAASAHLLQDPQIHNFHRVGDEDWLKFLAEKGKTYVISTGNLGTSADTYLYLYGPDGKTLLTSNDDNGGGLGSQIEWTATLSGTFFIQVRQWSPIAGGCKTNYTIQFGDFFDNKIYLPYIGR